jgi:hypothetical protein
MPKATATLDTHVLYIRKFPKELTRRVKSVAALQGCTMPQALASILKEYFKTVK